MYKKPSKSPQPDSVEHGFNYTMFLLNLRLRTEGEIREKMTNRAYNQEVINKVVEKLYKLGYLDDLRFAQNLIESYKNYKSYGFYMVKKKLMEKKLPNQLIEEVLNENYSVEDEIVVVKRFLEKEKLDLKDKLKRNKVMSKLKYRGFRFDAISKIK